jgi:hypothetical protein
MDLADQRPIGCPGTIDKQWLHLHRVIIKLFHLTTFADIFISYICLLSNTYLIFKRFIAGLIADLIADQSRRASAHHGCIRLPEQSSCDRPPGGTAPPAV